MHFQYFMLVIAISIGVCVGYNWEMANPNFRSGVNNARLLKTNTRENAEERAFDIKSVTNLNKLKNIQGIKNLKKISNQFKSKITPDTLFKWERKGVPPENVFTKLKLDKMSSDKLFANPDFKIWFAYTNMAVKYDPEQTIINFLTKRHDEITLTSMIEKTTKASETKEIAVALQNRQFRTWSEQKMSRDLLFATLNLDRNVNGVLTNPNLSVWIKYVDNFTKKGKLETPLIDALMQHYTDTKLLSVFKAAQQTKETQRLGENLELALRAKYRLHKPQI